MIDSLDSLAENLKHIDSLMDDGRWRNGDYLIEWFADHPKKITEQLNEIAIATAMSTSALNQYRRMSKFYDKDAREHIQLTYAINYNVMDIARQAGDTIEDVCKFLDKTRNNGDVVSVKHWRRELMIHKGNKPKPKPKLVAEFETHFEYGYDTHYGFDYHGDKDGNNNLEYHKKYVIKVYEVESEEE